MDDWRGERESDGLCSCVKGKACWQCAKEKPAGLLELSGRMPASSYATGTGWPALVSVYVFLIACVQVNSSAESLRLAPASAHTVLVCESALPAPCSLCVCVCMWTCVLCVCVFLCVGGEQMKTVLASHSMWSVASPLSLYLAYNPAPCFIMHSHPLLCGGNLTSQLASLFRA